MADEANVLLSSPLFSGLKPEHLERVVRSSNERSFVQGEALCNEGGQCSGLYLIKSGLVRIFKTSPEGKEQVLLLAGPGDTFNEVSIFDGGANPASAEALQPTVALVIPSGVFLALVRESPAVALSVINYFAMRLRHLTGLVEDLSFRHVTSRVAKLLLQLSQTPGTPSQLTHQQMAAIVGTAREMVGRSLKSLEEMGAIKIEGRRILIVKPEVLRKIV